MSAGKTIAALVALGWKFDGPTKCRFCGAPVEVFKNRERRYRILTRGADGLFTQHVSPSKGDAAA